jgi:hypothetical protein
VWGDNPTEFSIAVYVRTGAATVAMALIPKHTQFVITRCHHAIIGCKLIHARFVLFCGATFNIRVACDEFGHLQGLDDYVHKGAQSKASWMQIFQWRAEQLHCIHLYQLGSYLGVSIRQLV